MANLIDSYKKVYENKNAHISLGIIAIIWTLLSTLWDIKSGNINNYRQNPFDIIFNIIIGAYSIQFLHNSINNIENGVIPILKKIPWVMLLGNCKLHCNYNLVFCFSLFFNRLIQRIN